MPDDPTKPPIKRLDQFPLPIENSNLGGAGALSTASFGREISITTDPLGFVMSGAAHPSRISMENLIRLAGGGGKNSELELHGQKHEINLRFGHAQTTTNGTAGNPNNLPAKILEEGLRVGEGIENAFDVGPVKVQTQLGGTNLLGIKNLITNERIFLRNMGGVQPQAVFHFTAGGKQIVNVSEGTIKAITGSTKALNRIGKFSGGVGSAITVGEIVYVGLNETGGPGHDTYVTATEAGGVLVGAWAGAKIGGLTGVSVGGVLGSPAPGVGNVTLGAILGFVGAVLGSILGGIIGAFGGKLGGEASWAVMEEVSGVKRASLGDGGDLGFPLGYQLTFPMGQPINIVADGKKLAEFLPLKYVLSFPPPIIEMQPTPAAGFWDFNPNFRPIPVQPRKDPSWKTTTSPNWESIFWAYPPPTNI